MSEPPEDDKKAKVLHTRVPESLDAEIKERAHSLGISVSNLVRNVLNHAFGLVGDIVVDGASIGRAARGEGYNPSRRGQRGGGSITDRVNRILGWQDGILNLNAVCDTCNAVLTKGARAGFSLTERPGPRTIICIHCLEELSDADDRSGEETAESEAD